MQRASALLCEETKGWSTKRSLKKKFLNLIDRSVQSYAYTTNYTQLNLKDTSK